MKNCFLLLTALLLTCSSWLTACSTIASLFPDKQKQYRYSSDLPPLEIPPDLTSSTLDGAVTTEKGAAVSPETEAEEEKPVETKRRDAAPPDEEIKPRKHRSTSTAPTLAQNADDAPLIEIDEPFADAWNDVHRALGRLEVEVTDQNRSDRVFFVHYAGPNQPKKAEKGGLWSDIKSVFSLADSTGQDLRVKLEQGEQATQIYVLDTADKAVTSGLGLDLLKRLNDNMKRLDQPETSSTDGEAEPEKP